MRAGDEMRRRTSRRPALQEGDPVVHATYDVRLSDALLAASEGVSRDTELHDTLVDGLYVRLRPTGSKTYWYLDPFAQASARSKLRLGSHADYTVDQARLKALAISEARFTADGPEKQQPQLAKGTCIADAWANYRDAVLPPTVRERIERLLGPYLQEFSKARPSAVRRASLLLMIEKVALVDPNRGYEFHKHLRAFLSWCVRSGLIDANPISGATMPTRREWQGQTLNVEQLAQVYRTSLLLGSPSRELVGFLLLTGATVDEARFLRREQVDFHAECWRPCRPGAEGEQPWRALGSACLEMLLRLPDNQTYLFQSPHKPFPPSPIHLSRSTLDKLRCGSGASQWAWRDLVQSVRLAMAPGRGSKEGQPPELESERIALNGWATWLTTAQASAEEEVVI